MPNFPVSSGARSKGSRDLKVAGLVHGDDLSASARLITDAVSSFVEVASEGGRRATRRAHPFRHAYAQLVQSVPKENRLPLLRQMASDIEALAMEEGEERPASKNASPKRRVSTDDFMAGLMRDEKSRREEDIAAKRLISGAEMRERLGVSPQALSAALKAKRMFVLSGPSGGYYYPSFFADPRYDRPVLEKVCKALSDLPGASKWDFFTTPKISLGNKAPLEALAKGKLDAVLIAAAGFLAE
jgi:hypothetical protein